MSTVARIHRGLAFFFLRSPWSRSSSRASARSAQSFDAHRGSGSLLLLLSLILLILAAIGRREALSRARCSSA